MKLLLVEDSDHLRKYVAIAMERAGYAVDVAATGEDGLWHAESFDYDVIILDIMLPGIDGLRILRKLREQGDQTNVLLLTAKDKVADRVLGLDLGADDYLIKPFDLSELVARVQALVRRRYQQKSPVIYLDGIELDTLKKQVRVQGNIIPLGGREYKIFEYLVSRRGEVVSRIDIEQHIYDSQAEIMSNVVNSSISIIRKELAQYGLSDLIQTRRGLGYMIP
jgi:DNA-binding response OmpR family regulator